LEGSGKMDEIVQYQRYTATLKIRRGEGWKVRPEMEGFDGISLSLSAGWPIETGAREQYADEWAMIDEDGKLPVAWIATGDLVDLTLAS